MFTFVKTKLVYDMRDTSKSNYYYELGCIKWCITTRTNYVNNRLADRFFKEHNIEPKPIEEGEDYDEYVSIDRLVKLNYKLN